MMLYGLPRDSFTFLYVDDAVPLRKHVWASTDCYRYSFTCSYIDDALTSHEIHVSISTACFRVRFTFLYVDDVSTSQETTYERPRPVTGIALMIVPHRKHTYDALRLATGYLYFFICR
jgi:hypothetical protein